MTARSRLCSRGARVDDGWSYRGLRAIIIENDLLRAVLLPDRGSAVTSLCHKPSDTEFFSQGVTGMAAAPDAGRIAWDHRTEWLDGYDGGWQTVFPNGGNGSSYRGARFGLHAEAGHLPWRIEAISHGPDRAEVVLSTTLVRAPLSARRRFAISTGAPTLTVVETLVNHGSEPFPVSYGQHIAFGPPFLSEDCRVDLPGGRVRTHPEEWSPANRLKPGGSGSWPYAPATGGGTTRLDLIPAAGHGCEDQAYVDDMSEGWYAITNTRVGVGLAVSYPIETFPHLWYWLVCSGPFRYPWWGRAYVLGLEPFTSATNEGLSASVTNGSALLLRPDIPVVSEIHLTVIGSTYGAEQVDRRGTVTPHCGP